MISRGENRVSSNVNFLSVETSKQHNVAPRLKQNKKKKTGVSSLLLNAQ